MADICLSVSFQLDRSQLLEEISIFINKPMHYWDVTTDNVELKQSGIWLKAIRTFCSIISYWTPPPQKKEDGWFYRARNPQKYRKNIQNVF